MIAVDAMGGDFAPQAIVHGAYNAARQGIPIALFGDVQRIQSLLEQHATLSGCAWNTLPIKFFHCNDVINMGDEPSRAVLHKKDSSLVRAMQAVIDGNATAVVSAGSSGAALVAGALLVGRIDGILRPALGNFIPTKQGVIFCLDLGANTDCKAEYLEQFALMGHAYVKMVKGIERPRIALLSNGAEPYKGSLAVKGAYTQLIKSNINFVGNLEPRDMFDDHADVIVCDGFVGNILLKGLQGTSRTIVSWVEQERSKSWLYSLGLFLSRGIFKKIKYTIDYAQKGGALLLGVKQPIIIAHGCSNATAIENSIVFAHKVVQEQLVARFNIELQNMLSIASTSTQLDNSWHIYKEHERI